MSSPARFLMLLFLALIAARAAAQELPANNAVVLDRDVIGSRLFYLYYFRDARKVASILRSDGLVSPAPADSLPLLETLAQKATIERQAAQAAATSPTESPPTIALLNANESPATRIAPERLARAQATEEAARELLFSTQSDRLRDSTFVLHGDKSARDPAARVTISVVGDGAIHLYGPTKGIHRLASVIHAIDRPVGQVKIGLSTIQLELPADENPEQVHDLIDDHVRHARQLTIRAQDLFRQAFKEAMTPTPHMSASVSAGRANYFCPRFMAELKRDEHDHTFLAKPLNSLDLMGCLYLTALAEDGVRGRVARRFHELVQSELVEMDVAHCKALYEAAGTNPWGRGLYAGACPESKGKFSEETLRECARRVMTFSNLSRLLEGQRSGETLNQAQSATLALLRNIRQLEQAEAKLACMTTDQTLLENLSTRFAKESTKRLTAEDFLLDRIIDRQEEEAVTRREELRGHIASIDAQLSRMAMAFEDDVNTQFYRRALRHLRSAAEHWNVRMGQIETTSILTNDRTPARVSPSQTVQFDLPERPILAKEIIDGVEAIAVEGEGLARRLATRTAVLGALGPAGGAVADALGAQAPGERLQALVPAEQPQRGEVGNELAITPVIGPDGNSISYRLVYPYRSVVSSPSDSNAPARVVRHFIDTEVQTTAYEMREISRFRVGVQASRPIRGVPVFDRLPIAGPLFRTRKSRAEMVQETIILADCVIYPSILTLTGANWLDAEANTARETLAAGPEDQLRAARIRQDIVDRARARVDAIFVERSSERLDPYEDEVTPASLEAADPEPRTWRSLKSR